MNKKKLHTIKTSGHTVPKNYFNRLEDDLLTTAVLKNKSNSTGLKVPQDYFDTFSPSVLNNKLQKQQKKAPKVISIFSRKRTLYTATIAAAVLVLLFSLDFNTRPSINSLDTASIDNYLLNEIDSNDLVSLFKDIELNETQFIDYNFNDDIIDSFLEQEAVSDLITD